MNQPDPFSLRLTRRSFLGKSATGVGTLALASLLNPSLLRAADTVKATTQAAAQQKQWMGVINPLHFAPKAKRVIYLYMAGGPSHLETFDYKPKLAQMGGQSMPDS